MEIIRSAFGVGVVVGGDGEDVLTELEFQDGAGLVALDLVKEGRHSCRPDQWGRK